MTSFQLHPGENVLRETAEAHWMKSNLYAKSGKLILTDKRLVFEEAPTPLNTRGIGGFLVGTLLKQLFPSLNGGVRFDIPLRSIVLVTKDSFGFNEMISLIYCGQDKVRFGVGKGNYTEWETALGLARGVIKKAA